MRLTIAVLLLAAYLIAGCARSPQSAGCPGQFDPGGMTDAQLKRQGLSAIPERGATTLATVTWTVEHRKGWIARNYPDVASVDVGPGWGVTYSNDQYGDTTYQHAKDYLVVTIVESKAACPDPDRGTLFVLAETGVRVPVRFAYLPPKGN